jgi:hypothetical protein
VDDAKKSLVFNGQFRFPLTVMAAESAALPALIRSLR